MLKPNDKIAVAVSGGKDSVALLHILHRIEKKFPKSKLLAITIDEGITNYRDEAIEIASENCQKLGVKHIIVSFKELYGHCLDEIIRVSRKTNGFAPCSYCGVLRRRALNIAAKRAGADKLVTAHNLDDEVQTMILNIIHGDALRIARVVPVLGNEDSQFVQRIKPLCKVPENEVALYAYLRKIRFQTTPCPYVSESLRNDIRNFLNRLEVKHSGTKFTIFRSFERIRPALKNIVGQVQLWKCEICGEPTVGRICKPCQALKDIGLLGAQFSILKTET